MHALPFFTSSSKLTQQGVKIRLEALAEMTSLYKRPKLPHGNSEQALSSKILDPGKGKPC